MRKHRWLWPLLGVFVFAWVGVTVAQNSPGGAFLTNYDYVLDTANGWRWRTVTPFVIEGATDDAFETTLTFDEPTTDTTLTFPNGGGSSAAFMLSALTTNDVDAANAVWGVSNGLRFEGATADGNELTLSPADVAADFTFTLPDMGAAAMVVGSLHTTNTPQAANAVWLDSNGIVFEGPADAAELTIAAASVTADATLFFTSLGQSAGEQLQTDGGGTLTWEAAGSLRAFKNILGPVNPAEALAALVRTPVYRFRYKRPDEAPGEHVITTGDFDTEYVGVMGDDAPWAMHHRGRIFNPVNAFGYTTLAIQALEARILALEAERAARSNGGRVAP